MQRSEKRNPGVPIFEPKFVTEVYNKCGQNISATARELGCHRGTVRKYLRKSGIYTDASDKVIGSFEMPDLSSYQASTEEILEKRRKEYRRRRRAREERKIIPIKVRDNMPIALVLMGDPHLDDPGSNIFAIQEHLKIANETPGMFTACVGDYINNWKNRLAHLHAAQSVTQQEAWKLVEWFIGEGPHLFLIAGNHDVWSGHEDPLIWFTRDMGTIYEWHGARVALNFDNGVQCRINVRHTFPGRSIYNRAHGQTKEIRFGGSDHVYAAGHIHTWAYYAEENPKQDIICHGIQLRGYKDVDDHAFEKNFEECRMGSACVVIIDPTAESQEDFIIPCWSVRRAAKILTAMRDEHATKTVSRPRDSADT